MELYLQMGYGMKSLCKELLPRWRGSGVILSPRDMKQADMASFSRSIQHFPIERLLDPQCYERSSDHTRLRSHDYWKRFRGSSTQDLSSSARWDYVLESL